MVEIRRRQEQDNERAALAGLANNGTNCPAIERVDARYLATQDRYESTGYTPIDPEDMPCEFRTAK